MKKRAFDVQRGVGLAGAPMLEQGMAEGIGEAAAGDGFLVPEQCLHAAFGHDAAAVDAGARAEVDHVLGVADGVLVVLDHHDGVALVLALAFEPGQGVQQPLGIAWVQADGGLVEDVAHALQVGAELGGNADALGLAAGEGRRGPVQAQVFEADLLEEIEPCADLREDVAGDLGLAAGELESAKQLGGILDR